LIKAFNTHRKGVIMKSLLNRFFQFLEDFGRTKAASALAREGKYDQARDVINTKNLDK